MTTSDNPFAGEPTGDPGAGAGAGAGAPGTPPAGGSGAPSGGTPPPSMDFSKPELFQQFVGSLPKELQDEPTLKNFKSFEAVTRTMLSQQKMMGADKIVVPSPHATKEELRDNVFRKLGLPEDYAKYEVKTKEGAKVDAEFFEGFRKFAFENNILPGQAQAMVDWHEQMAEQSNAKLDELNKQQIAENRKTLQKEYGNAFKTAADSAHRAVKELGGDEAVKLFASRPDLNSNPVLFKMFEKAAKLFAEDKIRDGQDPGLAGALTPQAAQAKIAQMRADLKGPLYIRDHPGHAAAVKELGDLYEMANPKPAAG